MDTTPWFVLHPALAAIGLVLFIAICMAALIYGAAELRKEQDREDAQLPPRLSPGPLADDAGRRDAGDLSRVWQDQRRREIRRLRQLAQAGPTTGRPRLTPVQRAADAPADPRRI